jgi:uncharacterized protein
MSKVPRPALITALLEPQYYPHPADHIQVIETHISWVLLAGSYAYKIKKPVNFGFINYSSLELRYQYCLEELRLNRRTAPQLYCCVIPIGGTDSQPVIGEESNVIEYAVKMNRFDDDALLSDQIKISALSGHFFEKLGARIAKFHGHISRCASSDSFGLPASILQPMVQNFEQIYYHCDDSELKKQLRIIEAWSHKQFKQLQPLFLQRSENGAVRECHGDLHLGNIAMINQQPILFDAIEFNDNLRWIDVINEISFLCMDLQYHGRSPLAWSTLNGYLSHSGDYQGVRLLSFYMVYRAVVRAKISLLSVVHDADRSILGAHERRFIHYLKLAETLIQERVPVLVLAFGPSGSGKSYWSNILQAQLGLIWLRSDVERKRLFKLAPLERSEPDSTIYSHEASHRTYHHLLELSKMLLESGVGVIVDATLLLQRQRKPFLDLAGALGIQCVILTLPADNRELLARRILRRQQQGGDPSEATAEVMSAQLQQREPLTGSEQKLNVTIDPDETSESIVLKIGKRLTQSMT